MKTKAYTKSPSSLDRLIQEINSSAITIALDLPSTFILGNQITVTFKADISENEWVIMDGIIEDHTGEPIVPVSTATEVVTQMEKNDKTLRTVYAIAKTDSDGVARVVCKIPSDGRKIAFGDAEFEVRHVGDVVRKVEISDLERTIAWSLALAQDPNATSPLSDETIQSMGHIEGVGHFPLYPVLDHYDERSLPTGEAAPYNEGIIGGGIAMTYMYGSTEMQPVGGYGNLPGDMYMIIECQKAAGQCVSGIQCQFSIDWGEPND